MRNGLGSSPRDRWTPAVRSGRDIARLARTSTAARWEQWWGHHLVVALECRLQREACPHDGTVTCPLCVLVTGLGFLPMPPAQTEASRQQRGVDAAPP